MKPATSDQPAPPARDPDEPLPEYDAALIRAHEACARAASGAGPDAAAI